MTRLFQAATLGAALAFAAPSLALANAKQDRLCGEFAYMAQQLADLRISGTKMDDAQLIVSGQYAPDQLTHLQMVPQLAAFVYALPDGQLTGDVEGGFAAQCKAYKG